MVTSGFGFGLEIFDLEPGRRLPDRRSSGVLAGSKPDDGQENSVFACRWRTNAPGDEVGMALRRPPLVGETPLGSGRQLGQKRLIFASSVQTRQTSS